MRVLIDTNVIVSAFLSPSGTPAKILEVWQQERFELALSAAILTEYRHALGYESVRVRHRMTDEMIAEMVEGFRTFGVLVEVLEFLPGIVDDPDDSKFLECAIAAGASYIVSGDAHLLKLRDYQGIQVLPPAVFLAILSE